jgi:RNA-directed DNA polymerase
MGKTCQNLWPDVVSFANLHSAFKQAARGKRSKASVATFEYHLENNLLALQADLRSGSYQPGPYTSFHIHEPKKRLISAAPFRDRVVHHALCNVIEPIFERTFIYDSYANRAGKGTHRALDRCTHFMRRYRYLLPVDVRQFFPSIDHAILLRILGDTLRDAAVMELITKIVGSGIGVQAGEYDMVYYAEDDLFAVNRPRGLPIGNLTSQFWANVYLNGLDQHVKRRLKCRGYVRYVDDLLLFADDLQSLHHWRLEVIDYMASLRLTIHESSAQPRPCRCGAPFLGFQVFPDHRRLKRRNAVHARRRLRRLSRDYAGGKVNLDRVDAGVQGWINHARYGDTWALREAILSDIEWTRSAQ